MPAIAKVTALITRLGAAGPEVCVFDHPSAGVQLPAGTVEPGEDIRAGVLREAFEETGLAVRLQSEVAVLPAAPAGAGVLCRPIALSGRTISAGQLARVLERTADTLRIEVDGAEGVVPREALAFDAQRHLIHLICDAATPDEWFVVTPDGGGHCWRCRWLPLDAAPRLTSNQQPWLDVARPHLRQAYHPPARRRPLVESGVQTDLTIGLFWAPPWSGSWARISWLEPQQDPPDHLIQRVEAVAITGQHEVVAVARRADHLWTLPGGRRALGERLWELPGGRREAGERLEQALRRELDEEACVGVVASELVGFQHCHHLSGERAGRVTTDALFWARAVPAPFEPRFETAARRLLSLPASRDLPLWRNPITHRLLARAESTDRRRDQPRSRSQERQPPR